jgi:dolichol-phosphate mannosyltransferase
MKTCIIVPTYNEKENIASFIGAVYGAMKGNITVCVVDDNSPDGTAKEVEALKPLFPSLILINRPGKQGLGKAYVHGFKEMLARNEFDVLMMIDADFSEHPIYIPKLLEKLSSADVAVGSRYAPGARTVGWSLWRLALSKWASFYARTITGMPLYDLTMGFAAIKVEILKKIDLDAIPSSGYAFIMELKDAFRRAGARFAEVPITFTERVSGESKISGHIIREGIIAPWNIRKTKKR